MLQLPQVLPAPRPVSYLPFLRPVRGPGIPAAYWSEGGHQCDRHPPVRPAGNLPPCFPYLLTPAPPADFQHPTQPPPGPELQSGCHRGLTATEAHLPAKVRLLAPAAPAPAPPAPAPAHHPSPPRYATQSSIPQQQQPIAPATNQKYQKLTFNSGASYSSSPAPAPKKAIPPQQRAKPKVTISP